MTATLVERVGTLEKELAEIKIRLAGQAKQNFRKVSSRFSEKILLNQRTLSGLSLGDQRKSA